MEDQAQRRGCVGLPACRESAVSHCLVQTAEPACLPSPHHSQDTNCVQLVGTAPFVLVPSGRAAAEAWERALRIHVGPPALAHGARARRRQRPAHDRHVHGRLRGCAQRAQLLPQSCTLFPRPASVFILYWLLRKEMREQLPAAAPCGCGSWPSGRQQCGRGGLACDRAAPPSPAACRPRALR